MLPSERIGRIIIDGVVDPTSWSDYATNVFAREHTPLYIPCQISLTCALEGPQDLDNTLFAFANTCLKAGSACALNASNFSTVSTLIAKLDDTIDSLYALPSPVHGLAIPTVATAANLRVALLKALLRTESWDVLAEFLSAAMNGNFTTVVQRTKPTISPSSAGIPDISHLAGAAIFVRRSSFVATPTLNSLTTDYADTVL